MSEPDNVLTQYLHETRDNLSTLAAKMGRSPSTLTRAVNGERNPSIGLARDVERVTDGRVPAGEFIKICMTASVPEHESAA